MLKIRLQRVGRKNDPAFRLVVIDSREAAKSGKFLDIVGSHAPKTGTSVLDGEKIKGWIAKGVKLTPTVHNMLISEKIIEGKKINVLPKKTVPKKEEVQAAEPAPAEVPAEAPVEEAPAEEAAPEVTPDSAPVEEKKEETPAV